MKRIVFILVAAALVLPACDTETLHIGPVGDGDSDTAELTDADTDAMDTADMPPDGDEGDTADSDEDAQPESGVTVTMTNAGSDAAYVRNLWAGMDDHYGFTLWNDQGEQMHFDGGCLSTCEACSPIDCEALPEEVRQILPGDSVTMHWDGAYYRDGRCPYNENTSLQCRDRQQAAPGTYTVRFCYFSSLAPVSPQQTGYERRHGDIIGPLSTYAYPDDVVTCLTTEITLGDEPFTKQENFTADAAGVGFFAFGYCGQAWQYAPMSYVGIMDPLPDISQGSSALVPVQTMLGGTPYPCAEFGGMRYTRRDDDNTINLHSGLWGGVESCGDDTSVAHHTFVIPPPEPGLWHVYQELMVGAAIAPVDFTVTECPECIQCPELMGAPLGNSCVADCGLRRRRRGLRLEPHLPDTLSGQPSVPGGVCMRTGSQRHGPAAHLPPHGRSPVLPIRAHLRVRLCMQPDGPLPAGVRYAGPGHALRLRCGMPGPAKLRAVFRRRRIRHVRPALPG